MNVNLIVAVLAVMAVPIIYFIFLEDVPLEYFKDAPKEFVTQTSDLVFTEQVLDSPDTQMQEDETLEFLENIEEINDQNESEIAKLAGKLKEETARYTVTFRGDWSESTHPSYYVNTAHFSPMVAWSHNSELSVFKVNNKASSGIEKMAELGGTLTLEKELEALDDNGLYQYAVGERFDAPGQSSITIKLAESFSQVTAVTMLAPSPDWFVSAKNVSLYNEGEWVDTLEIEAFAYDAGTEEGDQFNISNEATVGGLISPLTDIPTGELASFGVFIFNKQ